LQLSPDPRFSPKAAASASFRHVFGRCFRSTRIGHGAPSFFFPITLRQLGESRARSVRFSFRLPLRNSGSRLVGAHPLNQLPRLLPLSSEESAASRADCRLSLSCDLHAAIVFKVYVLYGFCRAYEARFTRPTKTPPLRFSLTGETVFRFFRSSLGRDAVFPFLRPFLELFLFDTAPSLLFFSPQGALEAARVWWHGIF